MAAGQPQGGPSVRDRHREWLELVDAEGPFLALPVITRVWPQGMPQLDDRAKSALVAAKPIFERAWDVMDRLGAAYTKGGDTDAKAGSALSAYRDARDNWVKVVFRDVLGWGDRWSPDPTTVPDAVASSPDGRVIVRPTGVVRAGDRIGALVWVIDPVESLRDRGTDGWAESAIDRMEIMLRASGVSIGIVTDGRWWAVVSAPVGSLAASGVVDALTWIEEPRTRDAVAELLQVRRLLGGKPEDRLPRLFAASVDAAEKVTDALGSQVRRAVELVVAACSEASANAVDRGEPDPLPNDGEQLYEAVVAVLMRVVFLLFAEERGLLPEGELYRGAYGISDRLGRLRARARDENPEALDGTFLTWHRLLATSNALHAGANFEDIRLPAYGGSLFDPERFPFLGALSPRGNLALQVSDRVMMHVLEAVQVATIDGERRPISFRDVDVEQIGYIYEGLLGYTCTRADSVVVGLLGSPGAEPEVPLDTLDELRQQKGTDKATATAIVAWVKSDQPAAKSVTPARLTKGLADSADDADVVLRQVTSDAALRERLMPWLGVIRRDLRGRPTVIRPGGWLVTETTSRKDAGAHYTPRELAEEVVEHALEPLVYAPGPYQTPDDSQWKLKSSAQLLDLKVADIACGSGAFLVASARYLTKRLVEAYEREGVTKDHSPHALEVLALREVVASCLYGADINAMAVEMCKLSLWLVSLDPGQPFSFVDDKILHGHSLLGLTSLRQLEQAHIAPDTSGKQLSWTFQGDALTESFNLPDRVTRVIALRRRLASPVDDADPMRSARAKSRQLSEVHETLREASELADAVVAAGLAIGGRPGKALDHAYENLRIAIGEAAEGNREMLESITRRGLTPTVSTDYERWKPLHWSLQLPDVFKKGGFDAIVGNPPFLGGKKISGAMGGNVREWFTNQLAGGTRGHADLVAFFFLRAQSLLRPNGTLGLIATNTIAQGDTREVGLDRMVSDGFTITRAIQSRTWPAASANLEFAGVWGTIGSVSEDTKLWCDGPTNRPISPILEPQGRVAGTPYRLPENAGMAFIGHYVLGDGFFLETEEAQEWIDTDPRNSEVLFPFLNGEDLNKRPDISAPGWVIDFNDRSEGAASKYKLPFGRVLTKVKDERQRKNRKAHRLRWWQFAERRPGLRVATKDLEHVLVQTRVSNVLIPLRVPTGPVVSDSCVVFASADYGDLAVLSSSIHQLWAIYRGSTLGSGARYTPSDVFETFPRPQTTEGLEVFGEALDTERREIMLRRDLGLTKLYNLVNDPDIESGDDADIDRLRQIHVDIDHAVLAAYGWCDLDPGHGFHTYRRMTRWTLRPEARTELFDRLLEENHRRAAAHGDVVPVSDDSDERDIDDPMDGDE
ncbi:type II restriction endonuclease subunit M [Dietzia alimentaria]|nr:type II restriction endonuclease subunit M [Dietzia alimentaria]